MPLTSTRFPSSRTVASALRLVALLALLLPVRAQVTMDGTLGRAGALSGPAFQVTPDLGRQVGGNLFHSFSKLNLTAGESATFSGPATVQNVLARVTGGASSINGTLRSTIPGANLYLLNPGGVMFGPNARVDVSGSFVVSTADYVKLADGGRFDARVPANSSLTAAPLAKFGFLSMAPAKITVDGSQLIVGRGQTLTLVGGDLELKNAALVKAPQGTVNLTSVGAVATESTAAPELTDLKAGGTVTISTGASVDVSGEGGGLAVIRSRDLTVDNASVRANTTSGVDGRGIDVQLGGAGVLQNTGLISAQTSGSGRAGSIGIVASSLEILFGGQINSSTAATGDAMGVNVRASALTIDGRGSEFTGIFSDSKASATGKAGAVNVQVTGLLQVLNGGSISSDTFGAGQAGNVAVKTGALTIDGGTSPYFTFISSDSNPGATGKAGDVKVLVTSLLQALNGGSITSDTSGSGSAGKVEITAGALTIDGGTRQDFTGISSETLLNPSGNAGDVNVRVTGLLQVLNGGKISSTTSGSGHAGTVEITAGALTIDGGTRDLTGISSDSKAGATGNGGDLNLKVDGLLQVLNGGRIASDTSDLGTAGKIAITAGALTIDGGTRLHGTFISSDSNAEATGPAGDVLIQVTHWLQLLNGGSITSDTSGSGRAGRVEITAGALTIDGGTRPEFTGISSKTLISSETLLKPTGTAGDVTVRVTGLLQVLNGGKISSTTSGSGNAGTVEITAGALTIDGGTREFTGISSDSKEVATGHAGDVTVQVSGLLELRSGGLISSDTYNLGHAGKVTVRADALLIDGGTSEFFTGISSDSVTGATGNAGDVQVTVSGLLQVLNNGLISSDTSGPGNGGKLTVTAGTLQITGNNSGYFTGISSGSMDGGTGNAGDVSVLVSGLLEVLNRGAISSDTDGVGRAGKLMVTAGALTIAGDYNGFFTGISSDCLKGASGHAGDVQVQIAGLLQLLGHGRISSVTEGSGSGGSVRVEARDILLDQSASVTAASTGSGPAGQVQVIAGRAVLLRDNSSISSKSELSSAGGVVVETGIRLDLYHSAITTEASNGDGGELRLTATERLHLDHSQIFSQAGGSGGNIFIDPVTVSLNQSTISANALAGNGGNITINTGYLLRSQDSQITASSQFGVNSQISVLGPSVDLSGSLVTLPGGLLAAESRLPERCAVRLPGNLSSFISVGRGGLPLEPQDYQPLFLLPVERTEPEDRRQ